MIHWTPEGETYKNGLNLVLAKGTGFRAVLILKYTKYYFRIRPLRLWKDMQPMIYFKELYNASC